MDLERYLTEADLTGEVHVGDTFYAKFSHSSFDRNFRLVEVEVLSFDEDSVHVKGGSGGVWDFDRATSLRWGSLEARGRSDFLCEINKASEMVFRSMYAGYALNHAMDVTKDSLHRGDGASTPLLEAVASVREAASEWEQILKDLHSMDDQR